MDLADAIAENAGRFVRRRRGMKLNFAARPCCSAKNSQHLRPVNAHPVPRTAGLLCEGAARIRRDCASIAYRSATFSRDAVSGCLPLSRGYGDSPKNEPAMNRTNSRYSNKEGYHPRQRATIRGNDSGGGPPVMGETVGPLRGTYPAASAVSSEKETTTEHFSQVVPRTRAGRSARRKVAP